jgi:hypothetical protein
MGLPLGGGAAPLIVRLAGLPLDSMRGFSSRLSAQVDAAAALQARLDAARAEAVERLYEAVPAAPAELRSFLLAVKRDCHNARPLGARAADPRWAALRDLAAGAPDRVVELETAAEDAGARFEAGFADEVRRQRQHLLEIAGNPVFARGLALASPDLFCAIREHRGAPAHEGGRRERKMESALLRYVTRTAMKLSPFSTLTPVGLGVLRDGLAPGGGVRLVDRPWRARSLVRLSRYLPERIVHLLQHYAPFRAGMRVELNDSLTESAPGRYLLLRPRHWEVDAGRGETRFQREAMVAVGVSGPLVEYLAGALESEPLTYAGLVGAMARDLGSDGDEGVREQVDRLVELGVLQLVTPWPAHASRLERRLLDHLRTLPEDPPLDTLVERLDRLVDLQEGYALASDPVRSLEAMRDLIPSVNAASAALAGLEPAAVEGWGTASSFLSEDVFLQVSRGSGPAGSAALAEVPRASAEAAMRSARLLVRLSVLFEDRLEFQHTLAAVARERWAGRAEVGLLESLRDVQPLWQEYTRFHFERPQGSPPEPRTWNPLGLPELESLHRSRVRVHRALQGCARTENGVERFCPDALEVLLDSVPGRFTDAEAWGAMLLFQPASADGTLWVLNQFKEGTGRYGSRFTPAMDGAARDWYTSHMAARSGCRIDGEQAELLDVLCVQGSTLNVHEPQTRKLLAPPGEATDLPASRRVRLRDLKIAFDGPGGLPRLRGREGERYLPVNLGFAYEAHMPTLLRYLCAFGPSELWGMLPRRSPRREGDVSVCDRTVLGSLVVHRRSWSVPAARLRDALEGRSDAQAFAAVNRLRTEWGIPERVFFRDRVSGPGGRATDKPQYLDFTSPIFLPLLRSAVKGRRDLALTELLPEPEMCPADSAGRRWMVELMLDSVSLRAPCPVGAPARKDLYRTGVTAPTCAADHPGRSTSHAGSPQGAIR